MGLARTAGCALECSTDTFTCTCYRTVSKVNWSQKMAVLTDHDGKQTTRADFFNAMLGLLPTYFPHRFTHHWQQFSMDTKDETLEPSDLGITADYI